MQSFQCFRLWCKGSGAVVPPVVIVCYRFTMCPSFATFVQGFHMACNNGHDAAIIVTFCETRSHGVQPPRGVQHSRVLCNVATCYLRLRRSHTPTQKSTPTMWRQLNTCTSAVPFRAFARKGTAQTFHLFPELVSPNHLHPCQSIASRFVQGFTCSTLVHFGLFCTQIGNTPKNSEMFGSFFGHFGLFWTNFQWRPFGDVLDAF